ncbi:MAG: SDR family NAD(P)-dependent oxidoreductase [Clostridia bacterium]|nr:SDR family NAD(P)-dependent oxidoreductase [Clostridia bacterium]
MKKSNSTKYALVTGTTNGMGKATANFLLDKGWVVFGLDKGQSQIQRDNYTHFCCDVTNSQEIASAFGKIKQVTPHLDGVACFAGIFVMDSLLEIDETTLKKILDVNTLGTWRIAQHSYPLLDDHSTFLSVSSEVGDIPPVPLNSVYSLSKCALEHLAKAIRVDFALKGIKLSILRPGAVETPLLQGMKSGIETVQAKTVVYKNGATRFKGLIDKFAPKAIKPEKVGKLATRILQSKNPRYYYQINRGFLLSLLSLMPEKIRIAIYKILLR